MRAFTVLIAAVSAVCAATTHHQARGLPSGWSQVENCAVDAGAVRVFKTKTNLGLQRNVLLDNTPERCLDRCAAQGFGYAAVRMGVECWCSTEAPALTKANGNQCNYKCPGDNTPGNGAKKCGGFSASAVFKHATLSRNRPPRENVARLAPGWSVMWKCAHDPSVGTDFLKGTKVFEFQDNSPLKCTKKCSNAGYDIAGVEYGNECMCGRDFKGHSYPTRKPESECYMACTGDRTISCGAGHMVQFYAHENARRYNLTLDDAMLS